MFKILILVILILIVVWLLLGRENKKPVQSVSEKRKPVLKLRPPEDISVENDNGTIRMNWTEPEGAKSYILYYSNKPNFTLEEARTIGNINGNEFVISKVPSGTYYFQMSSLNGAVESERSRVSSFVVEICTLPSPPEGLTSKLVSDKDELKILLSWKPDATSDGYVIRLNYETQPTGGVGDHMIISIEDPITANYMIEGLDSSAKWFATISSVATHCGEGSISNAIQLN